MFIRACLLSICLSIIAGTAMAGLSNTFTQSGHLGLEVAGAAGGNTPVASGTLTLTAFPPLATVVKATLYASDINNGVQLDALFGFVNLGAAAPLASDAAFLTMYAYRWDVTSFVVPGQSSYSFTIGQNSMPYGNQIAGVALLVVWQDPNAPMREISVFDGIQQVGENGPETESVTFTQLPADTTTAWLFTVSDDNAATGESITFNSGYIGGPIDQNLGYSASLLSLGAHSQSGSNTLSITTGSDHMGWMIGAVSVLKQTVDTKSSSWGKIKSLYQ